MSISRLTFPSIWNIHPELLSVVKSNAPRPDPKHTPAVEQYNGYNDDVEHSLCTDISSTLEKPKHVYAAGLRGEASHQEQGQMDGV